MKKHPKSQPVKAKSEQQNTNTQSNPVIVTCTLPALTDEERTEKKEEHRRNRRKFRLEVAGFIVLSVYTFFTALMYRATKKSADAAKESAEVTAKQLELSERPLVSFYPTINRALSISSDGAQLGIQVSFGIRGHSPAMKFWQNIEMLPSTANAIAKREELCTRNQK